MRDLPPPHDRAPDEKAKPRLDPLPLPEGHALTFGYHARTAPSTSVSAQGALPSPSQILSPAIASASPLTAPASAPAGKPSSTYASGFPPPPRWHGVFFETGMPTGPSPGRVPAQTNPNTADSSGTPSAWQVPGPTTPATPATIEPLAGQTKPMSASAAEMARKAVKARRTAHMKRTTSPADGKARIVASAAAAVATDSTKEAGGTSSPRSPKSPSKSSGEKGVGASGPHGLTSKEIRAARAIRNREAALRSRQQAKERMNALDDENARLREENERLKEQLRKYEDRDRPK
eukprot:CAMPEP_0198312706 /NCGR_PEP_ID=MMETSP1450-20131203/3983_1 /TAXON_ID=753684 ORGANISM="Madagascaria erythrocladiodes, Strain CCMP3234" /NCGR_SAMPLE_ID=MMETSP1450 /ASSEMBLY_ACC=CAM_ASM_001115 /LENGTH=290 /DNA_ID=CAMNT_0044015663 /DNA_START=58 /DNA_END=930 /DNA_ORIENTATION=+